MPSTTSKHARASPGPGTAAAAPHRSSRSRHGLLDPGSMVAPRRAQYVAQFGYLPDYPAVLGPGPPQQARPGEYRPGRLAGRSLSEVRPALVASFPHGLAISEINPRGLGLPLELENFLSGQLSDARDPRVQAGAASAVREPRTRDRLVGNAKGLLKMTKGGEPYRHLEDTAEQAVPSRPSPRRSHHQGFRIR